MLILIFTFSAKVLILKRVSEPSLYIVLPVATLIDHFYLPCYGGVSKAGRVS